VRDTVEFTIFLSSFNRDINEANRLGARCQSRGQKRGQYTKAKAIKANADAKKIGLKTKAID